MQLKTYQPITSLSTSASEWLERPHFEIVLHFWDGVFPVIHLPHLKNGLLCVDGDIKTYLLAQLLTLINL